MKLIIDRFEGNFAVCETENKTFVNIPKSELPSLINEGDVLIQNADGKYSIDRNATNKRAKNIQDKFFGLFSDWPQFISTVNTYLILCVYRAFCILYKNKCDILWFFEKINYYVELIDIFCYNII